MGDLPVLVLLGIAGPVVGFALGWLIARARNRAEDASANGGVAVLNERLTGLDRERNALGEELQQARTERRESAAAAAKVREEYARLEATLNEQSKANADKLAFLSQVRESFQSLSAEALARLQEGARTDLAERQQALTQVVTPLQSALSQMDGHLRTLEQLGASSQATLTQQISTLGDVQTRLGDETRRLASALMPSGSRGRWGEIHLRRVVELAGLVERCDFNEQVTLSEGLLRPDLVIRLPGERKMVVDAKVPLTAFMEASEAPTPEARIERLQAHARALRDHIRSLGAKRYWKQLGRSPEFVVLFLPGEAFFSGALEGDPALVEFATEQGVMLSTPTTLIALLRGVAFAWKEEQVAANAQEIMRLGRELHDRIRTLTDHFSDLRGGLIGAVEAFNRTVGTLESRVLVTTRRLSELGAASEAPVADVIPIEAEPRNVLSLEAAAGSARGG